MATCEITYECTPVWFDQYDRSDHASPQNGEQKEDIIANEAGPHAVDLNIVCHMSSGDVQFQVQDPDGNWFTPTESSYTVVDSNCVRLPRANMPAVRIIATGDAKFMITGSLR